MSIRNTLLITACFISSTTASYAFFCPNNFNQIDFGYTTAQVIELCGKPDLEESKDPKINVPEEWSYFVGQTINPGMGGTIQGQEGTIKTTVTFDKDGKVINISSNGIGVGSTTVCGSPIALGYTTEQVKAACGEPTFVNKQQAPAATPGQEPEKIIEYTYNGNPSTVLIFEGGKLTSKR